MLQLFIYLDVLGSAKGWAASLAFHRNVKTSLEIFMSKKDTFSLGVCNGCQLMCSLGLVGNYYLIFMISMKNLYNVLLYKYIQIIFR